MLELVASPQQRQFGLDKRDTLPQYCLECDVRFACHGGCPKDRFIERPTASPGSTTSAPATRTSSTTSTEPMRFMAELLRRGRAPSEIVQLYAAEDARRGRNDPCTCGSGPKWKHCHGSRAKGRHHHEPTCPIRLEAVLTNRSAPPAHRDAGS